jgi:hypothetical protein
MTHLVQQRYRTDRSIYKYDDRHVREQRNINIHTCTIDMQIRPKTCDSSHRTNETPEQSTTPHPTLTPPKTIGSPARKRVRLVIHVELRDGWKGWGTLCRFDFCRSTGGCPSDDSVRTHQLDLTSETIHTSLVIWSVFHKRHCFPHLLLLLRGRDELDVRER